MRSRPFRIATASIALLAAGGCGVSDGSGSAAPSTTQAVTTTSITTTTTRPTTTTTEAPTTQDWLNRYGDQWADLAAVLDAIPVDVNTGDPAQVEALRTACEDLGDWATRINESDPIPDPALDEELGNLIDDAWSFSDDCVEAVDTEDIDLLMHAVNHLDDFAAHVRNFSEQLP